MPPIREPRWRPADNPLTAPPNRQQPITKYITKSKRATSDESMATPLHPNREPVKPPKAPIKPLKTASKPAKAQAQAAKEPKRKSMPPPTERLAGSTMSGPRTARHDMVATPATKSSRVEKPSSGAKKRKAKPESIFAATMRQLSTSTPLKSAKKKKSSSASIFQQRTPRSTLWASTPTNAALIAGALAVQAAFTAPFRLLDLAQPIRAQIWTLAVVDRRVFVQAIDSSTGATQPDVSMASRQVRREVLPIFYGGNVFDVSLDSAQARALSGGRASPAARLEKWATAIGSANVALIAHWSLSSTPSARTDAHDVYVSLRLHGSPSSRRSGVELHRRAPCLLPGFIEHGECVVENTPVWVEDLAEKMLGGAVVSVRDVVCFWGRVRERKSELGMCRCRSRAEAVEAVGVVEAWLRAWRGGEEGRAVAV